ncbi:unnamed protein product [Closterium sp. Yama58-4]|nr:unnamed protein product [Closterium sp. Yama58-4]
MAASFVVAGYNFLSSSQRLASQVDCFSSTRSLTAFSSGAVSGERRLRYRTRAVVATRFLILRPSLPRHACFRDFRTLFYECLVSTDNDVGIVRVSSHGEIDGRASQHGEIVVPASQPGEIVVLAS